MLRSVGVYSVALSVVGRFFAQVAKWILLLGLLVATWTTTGLSPIPRRDVVEVAAIVAAWLTPRLLLYPVTSRWHVRRSSMFYVALTLACAVVAVYPGTVGMIANARVIGSPALWAVIVAVLVGGLSTLADHAQFATLRSGFDGRSAVAARVLGGLADRFAHVAGPVFAAILLVTNSHTSMGIVAAICFLIGAFAAAVGAMLPLARSTSPDPARRAPGTRLPITQLGVPLVAAFGTGALATAVLVAVLPLAESLLWPSALAPALLGILSIGTLIGPLAVPRLLLHLSPALLALGLSALMAVAAVSFALNSVAMLVIPALVVLGVATINLTALRSIWLRRSARGASYRRATQLSLLALSAGQVLGALTVALLAPRFGATPSLVVVAVGQLSLVGIAVAAAGIGNAFQVGLSTLPVKSVVHKLSWDTRPASEPSDFGAAEPRVQRLAAWISRQAPVEKLSITLPLSGREYEIYRPTEDARENLFEQGRADPEKQMPYWAKVWPSGVALADVVVERKEEVSGQHVLELGAGLGVTASTVLEHKGRLVTADYSALPLAYCRLNTLVNTGDAPRATCFNWRHDAEVTAALAQPEFSDGFPLIIAGDVLYEGRDAEPLLNVVDRMLLSDGSLWLAEPVRRTAQRFLDSAALMGWEIESRQVSAEWPDATNGPVNLHFLRRSLEPDRISADLGGWRI